MEPTKQNSNPIASAIIVVSGVSASLALIASSGTALERLKVGALLLIAVAVWSFLFAIVSLKNDLEH